MKIARMPEIRWHCILLGISYIDFYLVPLCCCRWTYRADETNLRKTIFFSFCFWKVKLRPFTFSQHVLKNWLEASYSSMELRTNQNFDVPNEKLFNLKSFENSNFYSITQKHCVFFVLSAALVRHIAAVNSNKIVQSSKMLLLKQRECTICLLFDFNNLAFNSFINVFVCCAVLGRLVHMIVRCW